MELDDSYTLFKVDIDTVFKPFDCEDDDLNDFLLNKSIEYAREHLATTFVIENNYITVAYYSIFNDSVNTQQIDFASKNATLRFLKNLVSHPKRHLTNYPAIKIGRLAVTNDIQRNGLGKIIVNSIIDYAIGVNEECACKIITVDAYTQSLPFYEKLGFKYFSDNDIENDTRQMYLNLTPIISALAENTVA
jgi:predicted GNAT family N-acyltransferase